MIISFIMGLIQTTASANSFLKVGFQYVVNYIPFKSKEGEYSNKS